MANNLSVQMSAAQLTRRTSRSSGSQRSSRIEKPRSNHNSPRTVERRKTTSGTKRFATLDDHYNMMFGITGEEEAMDDRPEPTRPVSWHPSSAQFLVPSRSSVVEQAPSRNSSHGSDFYSLSARSSMYPEQTQHYNTYPNPQRSHRSPQDSDSSWQQTQSFFSTPVAEPMPWYLQEWARKNEAQAAVSRNGSNDFLPIQHPAAELDTNSEEDEEMVDSGKELVGMGLYDLPESGLSWSSGFVESTGKGLKLEETWQPPEVDDDEDEDDDDASSDDGSMEELPVEPKVNTNHEQLPENAHTAKTPSNMDGQSFFFDEDETYTKEWWFQQLKQPSLPVRDAGLGYGWL